MVKPCVNRTVPRKYLRPIGVVLNPYLGIILKQESMSMLLIITYAVNKIRKIMLYSHVGAAMPV
jgi:hypothetical protein